MNITHAVHEEVTGDKLKAIFTRQKELMEKYHYIEASSGLLQTEDCPVNLDDKKGQARLKDFSWRITEELGEALDALYVEKDQTHYIEELIDGLHFLTELTILAGRDWDTICQEAEYQEEDRLDTVMKNSLIAFYPEGNDKVSFSGTVMHFIQNIGMMCNCLKNKPWKQTQMETNRENFYLHLDRVWMSYCGILAVSNLSSDDIVDIYLKKSQVNKFRQRSNY